MATTSSGGEPAHATANREIVISQTRIVMRAVFPTKELRDEAVEKHHAIEGGEQTLRNLAAYVTEVARERSTGCGPAADGETMTEQETGQEGTVR